MDLRRRSVTFPLVGLVSICAGLLASAVRGDSLQRDKVELSTLEGPPDDPARFDRLLAANVRDERVDYLNIRKNHLGDLGGFLHSMAEVDPASLPRDRALAYWINLYNAATIKAIAERMDRDYAVSRDDFALFDEPIVQTKAGWVSLDQIENEITRPKFKEPRVHAAFNCGAVSCPPILPRAYRAEDLEQTLERNMKSFLNDPNRNTADATKKEIHLSKIFEWYSDDFGGREKLLAYVDRYHPNDLKGYAVSFKEYDWSLNFAPPIRTKWISITAEHADAYAEPGSDRLIGHVNHLEILEVLDTKNGWHNVELRDGKMGWIPSEATEDFSG